MASYGFKDYFVILNKEKKIEGFYSGDPALAVLPAGWKFMKAKKTGNKLTKREKKYLLKNSLNI